MKRPRHFMMQTAHGNHVRVQWTPEGLLIDTGAGWTESDEDSVTSVEYSGSYQQCPNQPYKVSRPEWWPR